MALIELPTQEDEQAAGSIPYGLLAKKRHPDYHADFWVRARAFYKGGIHLLENDDVMARVFPRHVGESDQVYEMRKKLSHYTNHSGAIINHLLGKLLSDPVRVQSKPEPDTFYTDLMNDCSPPDGKEVSLDDLITKTMLNAAQCQSGYALVEMPTKLDTEAMSLAEQEAAGGLDVWCAEVEPESVVDWEIDKSGEYLWALLCFKNSKRESVFDTRDTIHEEYWLYNREGWIRWDVRYKDGEEPKVESLIPPTDLGDHTFGKVPLVRLHLPDGLWIMSKLESLAREYFNKRNALSWAEFKALLPVLYEYLDPGMMPSVPGPGGEVKRATNQKRSPAHVQQRQAAAGQGDRAEWVGPPHAPFDHALKSCESVRDEMHRVVQQMALAADTKGAMLRRSEGSKQQDSAALDVVLGEYGKLARRFVVQLLQLVEAGRGDKPRDWTASGASKFDTTSTDVLIEEETVLDTIEMPSPTFRAERKKQIARKVLGDSVSEEKLAEIDKEIEAHFSAEGELAEEELREQIRAELEEQARGEGEADADDLDLGDRQKTGSKRMVISTFKGSNT